MMDNQKPSSAISCIPGRACHQSIAADDLSPVSIAYQQCLNSQWLMLLQNEPCNTGTGWNHSKLGSSKLVFEIAFKISIMLVLLTKCLAIRRHKS